MDSTLVNKIKFYLNLLKQTSFYRKVVAILEKNEFRAQIQRVTSMQENCGIEMVIYEIGSMENTEESCLQFALALLFKNDSHLVQDITIYDQNLSASEFEVINHFQCQCYSNTTINKVERPTLFFISGCKFYLWNNILEANKMPEELNRIVILGNPLKQWVPILPRNFGEIKYPSAIMENNKDKIKEFSIWLGKEENFDFSMPQWWSFHFGGAAIDLQQIALRHVCYNMSWHFFDGFVDPVKVPSIVLYGVGKIEDSENSRLQFSLAILLKRDFEWVEKLTAFEPVANPTEIKVMQGFGCDWISNNEKGRRFVHKPTLFFMPGVPLYVHNRLFSANWGSAGLNKMIVLGNSFKATTSLVPQMTYIFQVLHRDGIVCEVPVSGQGSGPPDDCSYAFQFYSWHFFNSSANSCDREKISVSNLLH